MALFHASASTFFCRLSDRQWLSVVTIVNGSPLLFLYREVIVMSMVSSVLFYGHDELLLATRGRIFEFAGFRVCYATELQQLARLVYERSVDLMVLCHSLTRTECTTAGLIAQNERIAVFRLLITETSAVCPDFKMKEVADGTVDWMLGPEALVDAACTMLHIAPRWMPVQDRHGFAGKRSVA